MIRNIRNKIRKNRGFTLVELMIVVAIVGILAALAIYGVTRYMKNAKTAEARNSVGQMSKDAAAAYAREKMPAGVILGGKSSALSNTLCTDATKVPLLPAAIKGAKYQSTPAEWAPAKDAADKGFKCLKFSMDQPQYYQYDYLAQNPATATGKFQAIAKGDLDGDGVLSTFQIQGAALNGAVALSPSVEEIEPEE